jgi:hypothetical protein
MVQVAFYKGKTRFFNRAVAWWTRGPYSHCELIVDGKSYSSSFLDGGVRVKEIVYDPEHWDIVDVPWADAAKAVAWFEAHMGLKYDVVGLAGFVVRRVEDDRGKYFCSEAVASSLGYEDAWRFDPNTLYPVLALMA